MNIDQIEEIIRQTMRSRNTPGMALAVTKDNQTVFSKGFGSRNLKQFQPMTPNTLIGIGSITKSFTAFAILKLQEMGKLTLEDSVAEYLPTRPFVNHPGIKIRHMLSHTTGIPSLDAGMLAFNYTFDDFSRVYPATSREDFLTHLAEAEEYIVFEPGERFFYNNDMYTCLGFIIEEASGASFDQFIEQAILAPLEMTRAVFSKQGLEEDPQEDIMTGYLFDLRNGKRMARESDVPIDGYLQAPGGLYVSMNEMLHYAQCLLNRGEFRGQQVLAPESVDALFNGQISTPYGATPNPQYALGWSVEEETDSIPHVVIQHGGGMGTSQSSLILVPSLGLGIMAAENASTGITPVVTRSVLASVLGHNPQGSVEDLLIASAVKSILGTYRSAYDMYELNVTMKSSVLTVDVQTDDGSFSFPILPHDLENLEFSTYSLKSNNKMRVDFHLSEDGQRIEFVSYDRFLYRRI